MPRFLELLITSFLIVLLSPFIVLIGIAICFESRGPIFYRQKRIGLNGKPFMLYKFRKMPDILNLQGPMLTGRFDPRLTKVGRFLERTKLDELPQLFNVMRGEMSLVGPRPEVEKFVKHYPEKWTEVLKVKPGMVGLNQILHRNESELLPDDYHDIEKYYVRFVLPDKLDIDIQYVKRRNIWLDLWILFVSVGVTIFGTLTQRSLRSLRKCFAILAIDTTIAACSYTLAYMIRFEWTLPKSPLSNATVKEILYTLLLVCVIRAGVFILFKIPRSLPTYLSLHEIKIIMRAVITGSLLILSFTYLFQFPWHPRVAIIDMAFLIILLTLSRISYIWLRQLKSDDTEIPQILLAGANEESIYAIEIIKRRAFHKYKIIGIIDSDLSRRNHRINGIEIIGHVGDMELLISRVRVDLVLIVESALSLSTQMRIDNICVKHNIPTAYYSGIIKIIEESLRQSSINETKPLLSNI